MRTSFERQPARKPARKPQRSATLGTMTNGKTVLWLSEDGQVKNGYILTPMPSAFGTAYRLGKADVGGCNVEYDVLLNGRETSCTCPGHAYRGKCKHVEALEALIAAGKLPTPTGAPKPTETKPTVSPAKEPWCRHCGDAPGVYCRWCSI